MNYLKKLFINMPLSMTIVTSVIVIGSIGIITKYNLLKKFNVIDNARQPFFTVSLYGIKDALNGSEDVYVPDSMKKKSVIEAVKKQEKIATEKAEKKLGKSGSKSRIPITSSNPVCTATDYGVANRGLLVDDSYIFNSDTDGIFAPDGTFKSLSKATDDNYFSDALFIGDSRTVGLYMFSNMKGKVNFFCKESMSVFNLPVKELDYHGVNGEESPYVLDNLLTTHQYNKIYICLGINEMYRNVLDYYNAYRSVIQDIRSKQPGALIFIEGNMHVSQIKSSTDATFNNTSLVQRNKAISELANGRDIFYIDMNPAVCDADGNLIADYTTDGVHLKANYYGLWADFLRDNVVN
jgi:lysophospholipase L1-like esterase